MMSGTIVKNIFSSTLNPIKMTKTLAEIVSKLNSFAPEKFAESWDNVGLLIEPFTPRPIQKILLTNDLTEKVLQEAVDKKTDLIISYHPPVFSGLKRITQNTWKERIVSSCLENRIAVYSPHTSWDKVRGGVNDWLAQSLPHTNSKIILPENGSNDIGAGRIADIESPITLAKSIDRVKKHTGVKNVHVSIGVNSTLDTPIAKFAVCAGSGGSVLKGVQVDLLISGEMSHHDVLEAAHNNVSVILCNHSNSERGFLHEFKKILTDLLDDSSVEILVSETDADPLQTY